VIGEIVMLGILSAVGLLLLILGLIVRIRQKISLIHDYHHSHVAKKDVAPYTKLIGTGLIIMGVATAVTGIVNAVFHTGYGWLVFVAGFTAGLIVMDRAQKRYNGSWFG